MAEINLLDLYPRAKRDIAKRSQANQEDRRLANLFEEEYFDGTREQGYGGYRYDGRWVSVVKRFKDHYKLKDDAAILDVGCAKGFMLHDFHQLMPKAKLAGIDVSHYALRHALEDVRALLQIGNAKELAFPDQYFDLVISINTIHNLEKEECFKAVKEIERVGKQGKFISVDAYRNEEEKERMFRWNLTAKTIMSVDEWKLFFAEAGYTGDYYWFIP